ncbi:MAG: alpha/beta hydrolase [Treponema sp.]|jgi:acetyl esterase/lipase|nr:alpha/beta hydrolase [Treponema sp.]
MRTLNAGALAALCRFFSARRASAGRTPEELRYTPHQDLRYGPHKRHTVDISVPHGASQGVILFIHGGAWLTGGKEDRPAFLDGFRERFIVASMNHRYIDETVHINDVEEDVAAAVAYIREFSLENNRASGRLILMGHSSGAHLALLYAYKNHRTSPIPPAFCVDMAGPADMGDIAFLYNFKKIGGEKFFYGLAEKAAGYQIRDGDITREGYSEAGKRVLAAISPISFAAPDSPPVIIVHDVTDKMVPYANSAALHHVLQVHGVVHNLAASYSGLGHVLGAKKSKGGAAVYDKTLTAWIVRVMNEYIDRYCGTAD